ncbi:hypothetical protein ACFE04_019166 [Oxalis oulophora]
MAFMQKLSVSSYLRSQSPNTQSSFWLSRRGFHIEPGLREQALLSSSPYLARFKSHKKSVQNIKRIGDVLTILVVAGCCHKIYVKAVTREEARAEARAANENAS